jgi:uncharacterized SAM-binding protein YcdF (DUF218 family)
MANLLIRQGIQPSDVIVESGSRTTWENATQSKKVLEARGVHRIVLVTEGVHLYRAMLCFGKQGFEVIPAGCHYRNPGFKASLYDFLPAAAGLDAWDTAVHEWLGVLWYRLTGKI